jgi:hypothetical protein
VLSTLLKSLYVKGPCWNPASRWIVGGAGLVLHTTDAGLTWRAQPACSLGVLRALTLTAPRRLWLVGDGGALCSTVNGGGVWRQQDSATSGHLLALARNDVTADMMAAGQVRVGSRGTWETAPALQTSPMRPGAAIPHPSLRTSNPPPSHLNVLCRVPADARHRALGGPFSAKNRLKFRHFLTRRGHAVLCREGAC